MGISTPSKLYTVVHICLCACVHVCTDVCWCKGSVAEKIFTPLVERIKGQGGKVRACGPGRSVVQHF